MFVIHDSSNNIPLFVGKVGDPTEGKEELLPVLEAQEDLREIASQPFQQQLVSQALPVRQPIIGLRESEAIRESEARDESNESEDYDDKDNDDDEVDNLDAEERVNVNNFSQEQSQEVIKCGENNYTEGDSSDIRFPCNSEDAEEEELPTFHQNNGQLG